MKTLFVIFSILLLSSCTTIKQNSQEWHVIYPDTKDPNIVKVKGLYKSKGKLLYNNRHESNIDKKVFDNIYLFKPTTEQIIQIEQFVIQYMVANNPACNNDTTEVIKKYKRYGRLYTGYICNSRDSIFIIALIEKPQNIRKYKSIPIMIFEEDPIIFEFHVVKKNKNLNLKYYNDCSPIKVNGS